MALVVEQLIAAIHTQLEGGGLSIADTNYHESTIQRLEHRHLSDMLTDDALTGIQTLTPLLRGAPYMLQAVVVRLFGAFSLRLARIERTERTKRFIDACGGAVLTAMRGMRSPNEDEGVEDNAARSVMAALLRKKRTFLPSPYKSHLAAACVFALNGEGGLSRDEYRRTLKRLCRGGTDRWWLRHRAFTPDERDYITEVLLQGFMDSAHGKFTDDEDDEDDDEDPMVVLAAAPALAPALAPMIVDAPAVHAHVPRVVPDDLVPVVLHDPLCKFLASLRDDEIIPDVSERFLHMDSRLRTFVNKQWPLNRDGTRFCVRPHVTCGVKAQDPCDMCGRRTLFCFLLERLDIDAIFNDRA